MGKDTIVLMPESDYDPMPKSYREAFHKALVRTNDWICHSGPEPELYLDGTPMTVQTLFHLMTKFDQDLMRDVEIQLTFEILGDVWEAQRAAINSHPSCRNAAKYVARRIAERKAELLRGRQ